MKSNQVNDEIPNEETFEHKVEIFLRSTGRLFPITDQQVKAFETGAKQQQATFPDISPETILKRGYITQVTSWEIKEPQTMQDDFMNAAARNGGNITPEIRRRMDEDRNKDKNHH